MWDIARLEKGYINALEKAIVDVHIFISEVHAFLT